MSHKLKILIVEDNPIIADDLQFTLEDMGFDTAGPCDSAQEALDFLKSETVDFAIFDIKLKGETDGIELASIVARKYKIPFVFLTTVVDDEFIERAKKVKPYAYMLKPFNDRELKIAIELAIANFSSGRMASLPGMDKAQENETTEEETVFTPVEGAIFLKKNSKYIKVQLEDILYIEADGNYTKIHTTTDKYMYAFVLKKIEDKLPSDMFMRIHRTFIANVNHISEISGNMIHIGTEEIPVSRNYQKDLFKRFDFIK